MICGFWFTHTKPSVPTQLFAQLTQRSKEPKQPVAASSTPSHMKTSLVAFNSGSLLLFCFLLFRGQNLASQMQHQDPNFVENLRRQFNPSNSGSSTTESSGDTPGSTPRDRADENGRGDAQ